MDEAVDGLQLVQAMEEKRANGDVGPICMPWNIPGLQRTNRKVARKR
jgi:hypothetical protein